MDTIHSQHNNCQCRGYGEHQWIVAYCAEAVAVALAYALRTKGHKYCRNCEGNHCKLMLMTTFENSILTSAVEDGISVAIGLFIGGHGHFKLLNEP